MHKSISLIGVPLSFTQQDSDIFSTVSRRNIAAIRTSSLFDLFRLPRRHHTAASWNKIPSSPSETNT